MLRITIQNLQDVLDKVSDLEEALDVQEILDESEALLLNRIRQRFLAEEGPDGEMWEQSQRARATDGKTLYDTGTLFHSLQAYADGLNGRAIGTDVPYARFHQLGTKRLPVRAFLGFNEEDLLLCERRILQRVAEALE